MTVDPQLKSDAQPESLFHRRLVLLTAFLAWMFAGLEISLFILIHRQMMLSFDGFSSTEEIITTWFAWFQAAFLFGAATGGWLFGWLGDRAGRTRAMGLSILCYSTFTLCCYWVVTPQTMLILRFLACLGIGGVWPNAVALVAEAWPAASRPFLAGLLGAAANVGFVLLGTLAYFYEVAPANWRWTFLVGATPIVLGLFTLTVIPESVRWKAARAKQTESTKRSSVNEVLRYPLIYRTILGVSLGAIPVVGTAANANWLVPWSDQIAEQKAKRIGETRKAPSTQAKAKTQIIRSSGATLGSLLGGLMASLLGRRMSYFLISLCSLGVSTYIFTQLNPEHPQFPIFTFILGFVGVTFFGWLPLFLPELFPTHVRATGTGISFNTGRVVAAVIVLSAGVLIDQFGGDYARVGFWSGMIYCLGMIIIWFAPRRTTSKLED